MHDALVDGRVLDLRRKDAEQKLRATETNLTRLSEIVADMEVRANALRRRMGEDVSSETGAEVEAEETENAVELSDERFAAMQVAEQIILTVSENGYGKRTSSYEYRTTGRGGKGIVAMAVNARNGKLIAVFPVVQDDEIMLVTDGGQLIRCPVGGIRIAGRGTQGVIVFNTAEDERVVSVEHIGDVGEDEEEDG